MDNVIHANDTNICAAMQVSSSLKQQSHCRNFRRRLLSAMPTLQNFDDMPCRPQDKRLAAAFIRGGRDAEVNEREIIRQEEEQTRAYNRLAVDNMVQQAKADAAAGHSVICEHDRFVACAIGARSLGLWGISVCMCTRCAKLATCRSMLRAQPVTSTAASRMLP
jgi:hypothetical protein